MINKNNKWKLFTIQAGRNNNIYIRIPIVAPDSENR